MNYLTYALTAPADKATFERLHAALADFEAWAGRLHAKKIDIHHELVIWTRLRRDEALLAALETQPLPEGAQHGRTERYLRIRADRIYFRVLVLDLLNQEDAWDAAQAAKAAHP